MRVKGMRVCGLIKTGAMDSGLASFARAPE